MQTFTAKQVAAAFRLHPTTLRKWLNQPESPRDEALHVAADDNRAGGWRRFGLTDCVRINLLRRLTDDADGLAIASGAAVKLVNAHFDTIDHAVAEIERIAEQQSAWPTPRGPWLLASSTRNAQYRSRVINSPDEMTHLMLDPGFGPMNLLIEFCDLVRSTVGSLTRLDVQALSNSDD
jgi:hypothetical protein